jgi:choice-of-anchor A domain-containing protein
MTTLLKTAAAVTIAFAATAAQANVVDLGIGGANLFSLGAFSSSNSDVEGSVLVAGSMSASSYSVNDKNKDAFSDNNGHGIALAVGGALNYSNGSIKHGTIYVAGAKLLTSVGTNDSTTITTAPVNFNALSASVKTTSTNLSKLAATGTVTTTQYGGMTLQGTGTHKGVEVFNISGSDLAKVNNFSFSGLDNNSTLIINVSGTSAIGFNQNGVSLDGFSHYNVLYNFYQSTSMNIQNVGVQGSILAPLARVTGGNGQINGEVVVGNWASNVQVNAQNFFKATNVQGFGVSPVPEADSYAMLLAGLAVVGVVARRKQRA